MKASYSMMVKCIYCVKCMGKTGINYCVTLLEYYFDVCCCLGKHKRFLSITWVANQPLENDHTTKLKPNTGDKPT